MNEKALARFFAATWRKGLSFGSLRRARNEGLVGVRDYFPYDIYLTDLGNAAIKKAEEAEIHKPQSEEQP